MYLSIFATLGLSTIACLAAPAPAAIKHVHHKRRLSPDAWVKRDRVHPDLQLPTRIGLAQSNLDKGHDYPGSASEMHTGSTSVDHGHVYVVESVYLYTCK